MSIILSRNASENILLNKHKARRLIEQGKYIKGFPIVDSKNPVYFEEIAGNEYRVFKKYPAGFDFLINIINAAWATGNPGAYFRRIDEYWWKSRINEITWREYFLQCGDFTQRQSQARSVMQDLQTGLIIVKGKDRKGRYIYEAPPFRIMGKLTYEDGTGYRDIFLNHAVFGSLITMSCKEKGGDGFGEIPSNLYPILTSYSLASEENYYTVNGEQKKILKSHNPVYRINILGLMKNTHKKDSIELPRDEFLETVVPEYLDRNGNLEIRADDLRASLETGLSKALSKLPEGKIVKNYYLGFPGGTTVIHFRKE